MLSEESIFIAVNEEDTLYMKRFYTEKALGMPILMLHGAIENGHIFYTQSQKGLGPYLARRGYDVYIADLRGRGKSYPVIDANSKYGQSEAISEDIPAFVHEIAKRRGDVSQHWVAHSWGGVLMASALLRYPELKRYVGTQIYIGTKRSVRVKNLHRYFMIDFIWKGVCRLLAMYYGYLPAKRLRIGADDETKKSLYQSIAWVKPLPWCDSDDGFSYQEAAKHTSMPPTLYITGTHDHCLGHADDMQRFRQEVGVKDTELMVLGKQFGYSQDYDHISILTAPQAEVEHFPLITAWIEQHNKV